MDSAPQRLRTVADFAALPKGQRQTCLRAFNIWLNQLQRAELPPDSLPRPQEFLWSPRSEDTVGEPLTAGTEIGKLGLRPGAVTQFMQMNIFALEDFAEVSLLEMSRVVNVGSTTVFRIREMLTSVGLDFLPSKGVVPTAYRVDEEPCAPSTPEHIDDACHVRHLGLRRPTVRRLVARKLETVGALIHLPPHELASRLPPRARHEVFAALCLKRLKFDCDPNQIELWRSGFIPLDQLVVPGDDDSVLELHPWLGPVVNDFENVGIRTVADLRSIASTGVQREVRGIGPYSWSRVRRHFGIANPSPQRSLQ